MRIPSDSIATLGDACWVRSGFASRGAIPDGGRAGLLTIQQGDLTPAGDYALESALRTSSTAHSYQHFAGVGEVVFRSRGPHWSAWEVPELDELLLAVAPLFILRPIDEVLDPGYLRWALMQPPAQHYFAAEAMGTGVKMITKPVLERLPLVVPAIETQRLVAGAARLADRERALNLELVELRHRQLTTRITRATHSDGKNS